MNIVLNGEEKTLPDKATAETLTEILKITGQRIAMEINREIVPRSTYASHTLHEGDQVEIVHAIGGGAH